MTLADAYLYELGRTGPGRRTGDGGLSATVLAQACSAVLPVAGVSITVDDPLLRLPLAASDATARQVEQWEATLGDGPGVDAAANRARLVADSSAMTRCWPAYTAQVFAHTTYRSVAVLPLATADAPAFGLLVMHGTGSDLTALDITDVQREVADLIAEIVNVSRSVSTLAARADVDEASTTSAGARRQVWMAVAITAGATHSSESDALHTLRASAQRRGLTLDDLAARLCAT